MSLKIGIIQNLTPSLKALISLLKIVGLEYWVLLFIIQLYADEEYHYYNSDLLQ